MGNLDMAKRNALLGALLRNKWLLVVSFIFLLLSAVLAPLKSFIFQWLVESQNKAEVFRSLAFGVVVVLLNNAFEFISRSVFSKARSNALTSVRGQLVDSFQSMALSEYSSCNDECGNKFFSALTNETRIIGEDYYDGIFNMVIWICIGLSATIYMSRISTLLLVVSLVLSVFPFIVPKLLSPYLSKTKENNASSFNRLCIKAQELINGYESLLINNCKCYMKSILHSKTTEYSESEFAMQYASIASSSVISLVAWLPGFSLLVVGTFLVMDGTISLEYLITANTLINFILLPFRNVANAYTSVKSTLKIRNKLNSLLKSKRDINEIRSLGSYEGLSACDVFFKYRSSDRIALDSIDLSFERKEKVAILGSSGSGKTTLLRLITKHFSSYKGNVCIFGNELREIDDCSFFERVAYIPQNPTIFEDTVRNNICLGNSFPDFKMERAVRLAGLESFVENLPDGLETNLREGGANISGGQQKRIAIARAIIRDCEVIFADEVTSSLDIETTNAIVNTLLNLPCSVVVVTHDVFESYMDRFDRIIYLDNGGIVENGTYDELMSARKWLYSIMKSKEKEDSVRKDYFDEG